MAGSGRPLREHVCRPGVQQPELSVLVPTALAHWGLSEPQSEPRGCDISGPFIRIMGQIYQLAVNNKIQDCAITGWHPGRLDLARPTIWGGFYR